MFGFNVSLQDLKDFRKFGSKTPGHPEYRVTEGVEVSTLKRMVEAPKEIPKCPEPALVIVSAESALRLVV